MKDNIHKIVTWVLLGIALLFSVFAVVFALNVSNEGLFDVTLYLLEVLIVASICCMAVLGLYRMVKMAMAESMYRWRLIAIVALFVVGAIIGFAVAKGADVPQALLEKNGVSEGTSKTIGAAIIFNYIMVIVTVALVIATEVLSSLKKK